LYTSYKTKVLNQILVYKHKIIFKNIHFSNAQFKGQSYTPYAQNFTVINAVSPEIIKVIVDNQSKINTLFEQQNHLFNRLLNEK